MAGLAEIPLVRLIGIHDARAYGLLRRTNVTSLKLLDAGSQIVPSHSPPNEYVRQQIARLRREANHGDSHDQLLDGIYLHLDQYDGGPKRRETLG